MTKTTLDISEARDQLTKLEARLRDDHVIWVTRRGKRAFAVVDSDVMATVLETLEILADPAACRMLQQSLQDVRAGRLRDHEAVKRELLHEGARHRPVDRNRQRSPKKAARKSAPRSPRQS